MKRYLHLIKRIFSLKYLIENRHRIIFVFFRAVVFKILSNSIYMIGRYLKWGFTRHRELKNKHLGETVYILGNGPSLKDLNWDFLKGKTTFASNKIYLAFEDTNWRPTYYSVEDDLVLIQNKGEIEKIRSIKIFPDINILHHGYDNAVIYINYKQNHHYPELPVFGKDIMKGIYWGSSIVYTQIQLACYMGAAKIVLMGVDFSFNIPDNFKNSTKMIISEGEVNHFHKDYRKKNEKWNIPNLENQVLAFRAAVKFCKNNGIELVNATVGTKLQEIKKEAIPSIYKKNDHF